MVAGYVYILFLMFAVLPPTCTEFPRVQKTFYSVSLAFLCPAPIATRCSKACGPRSTGCTPLLGHSRSEAALVSKRMDFFVRRVPLFESWKLIRDET